MLVYCTSPYRVLTWRLREARLELFQSFTFASLSSTNVNASRSLLSSVGGSASLSLGGGSQSQNRRQQKNIREGGGGGGHTDGYIEPSVKSRLATAVAPLLKAELFVSDNFFEEVVLSKEHAVSWRGWGRVPGMLKGGDALPKATVKKSSVQVPI